MSPQTTIGMTFSEHIKLQRELSGLTQYQVAMMIGTSEDYLHHIETNLKKPSKEMQERIVKFYNDFQKKRQRTELTDFEKGWLSALIDGEGSLYIYEDACIRHHKRITKYIKKRATLSISNNNLDILRQAKMIIGSGTIVYSKSPKGKQQYIYCVGSLNTLKELLPQLLPHFIVKKENAKKVLKFIDERQLTPWGQRSRRVYLS